MARRINTILPNLTFEEAIEVSKIYSILGMLDDGESIIKSRPFRAPHHTASKAAIVGGGKMPAPGEISLAHLGVLFMDEFPEFNKSTLEGLRGPLEDKYVNISRVNGTIKYPCNFMLVASMNPCKCGNFGSDEKECICTAQEVRNYIGKISGPLLDRIDIHIEVKQVKYKNFNSELKRESSKEIKKRVDNARKIQVNRYREYGIYSNSELTPNLTEKYCVLGSEETRLLEKAFDNLGFSARAYNRILKVARTIADLDGEEKINVKHLSEAVQYRSLDRKYGELL